MSAKLLSQHSVKDMGRRVVEHGALAVFGINDEVDPVANLDAPLFYLSSVNGELRRRMLGIHHLHSISPRGSNGAPVAYLAARFAVERGLCGDEIHLSALANLFSSLSLHINSENF